MQEKGAPWRRLLREREKISVTLALRPCCQTNNGCVGELTPPSFHSCLVILPKDCLSAETCHAWSHKESHGWKALGCASSRSFASRGRAFCFREACPPAQPALGPGFTTTPVDPETTRGGREEPCRPLWSASRDV